MFADRVRIHVTAGSGGDGSPSMRREAHVPRGGPDGGDGGRGGSVVLVADAGLTSLGSLRHSPHVRATSGRRGARRRAHGRYGVDAIVTVPPGTVARRHPEGDLLGEVLAAGDRLVVARGGRGGRGNVHFATSTHQAPRHYERGDPGEEGWVELELKLIAELGLHDPALLERPMRVVVTKQDLPEARTRWPAAQAALRDDGLEPLAVSAHDGSGLDPLREALTDALGEAERREAEIGPAPVRRVHRFDPTAEGWEVVAEADGLRIRGAAIERSAARTDFTNAESRDRFQRRLERLGIDAELRRLGARSGTNVRIGALELEWGDEE